MSNISISLADFSALVIELEKLRKELESLKQKSVSDCNYLADNAAKAHVCVEAWEKFWEEAWCLLDEKSHKHLADFVKSEAEISKNISPRLL